MAVLLVALGACGGAPAPPISGPDHAERVVGAVRATLDAGSVNFVLDQHIVSDEESDEQRILSEGVADLASGLTRTTTETRALGVADVAIETVEDDAVVFLRLPDGSGFTPWLRVTLGETEVTPQLEQILTLSPGDPGKNLAQLLGVTEAEQVGEENVRGADTTHYRAVADLRRAAEQAEDADRAFLEQWIEQLGVTELPTDVWLDDQGRVVRQSFAFDLAGATLRGEELIGELEGEATTTIEYFDFGTEVDVQPPPADQVTDYEEL
jgi:hypothetical protein